MSDFGIVFVAGQRRVASPPARMTHCIGLPAYDRRRSVEVETKIDLDEAFPGHCGAQLGAVPRIEHEKSSATRSDHLAAKRTGLASELIPAVNAAVRHIVRSASLHLPMLVHQ